MDWTALLVSEIESTYRAAEGLVRLVDRDDLSWKPSTGSNWMTTGQLLEHLTEACGFCIRGFVSEGWGEPQEPGTPAPDGQVPAESMRSAKSVEDVLEKLRADKAVALDQVKRAGERALATKMVVAPWDPNPMPLGRRLLLMVQHLHQHKGQLFYYLKLQGKPVDTGTLWGM